MQLTQLIDEARARFGAFRLPKTAKLALPEIESAAAAGMIDHTLLRPEASAAQIETLCREAVEAGFASVCVNPTWVSYCRNLLVELSQAVPKVAVCTVIGFPLGATLAGVKAFETTAVIAAGASEVDMVLNIGALRDGNYAHVYEDICAVVEAAAPSQAIVKVIFENCLLTDEQKAIACALSVEAGADFVKTSTGFNAAGATVEDVALMRYMVGPATGVKAAGGVRTAEDFRRMVAVGATRIGTSAGLTLVAGLKVADASVAVANGEDY